MNASRLAALHKRYYISSVLNHNSKKIVLVSFSLILCLFQCKMFFVVKYFQRNHFSEKMIFLRLVRTKKSPMTKNLGWPNPSDLRENPAN
jgi:hypothetical protein